MSRWEGWIESPGNLKVLRAARAQLKIAHDSDRQAPATYPINTAYALAEIHQSVSRTRVEEKRLIRFIKLREPKSLGELVPERLIRRIWEDHHSGEFKDAILQAAHVDFKKPTKSWRVFQGIVHAIEIAYLVNVVGPETLPKPKVNILHAGLYRIAKAAGLADQTDQGFAEFLDDLCPCGLRSHREAVRKLRSRSRRGGLRSSRN